MNRLKNAVYAALFPKTEGSFCGEKLFGSNLEETVLKAEINLEETE